MLLDLLTVVVMGYIGSRLVVGLRRVVQPDMRDHVVAIVRGLRARHFLMAPPVLCLVLLAASLLLLVPPLRFGWWTAIGGLGNPVTGATDRTTGTPLEWIIPTVFLTLLLPALPLFAEREEQMFRAGAEQWTTGHRIRRGVEFGLVHAIVGIPIGVALALSIGGWYFTWRYLRGGVAESTRAHLAYNLEVVAIVVVVLATGAT
jgi:hypothetical protein